MDVHLDGVVAHLLAPFAQALDQLRLAHQPPGALQQHLEQAQLARRQLHHLAVDGGHAPCLVVHQWAVPDGGAGGAHAPAGQGTHARFQLLQAEGLGHVIVGPQIQTLDALFDGVGSRQDQHRQAVVAAAQATQHLQAMHTRQAQIQDQQIKMVVHQQGRIGLSTVGHMIHHGPGISQAAQQAIGQHLIVFCYQNTHAFGLLVTLFSGWRRAMPLSRMHAQYGPSPGPSSDKPTPGREFSTVSGF